MITSSVIHGHPQIVSGEPVFIGTRVPVRNLLGWLEGGYTLDEFLDNFPSVRREQAITFLEEAASAMLSGVPRDAWATRRRPRRESQKGWEDERRIGAVCVRSASSFRLRPRGSARPARRRRPGARAVARRPRAALHGAR